MVASSCKQMCRKPLHKVLQHTIPCTYEDKQKTLQSLENHIFKSNTFLSSSHFLEDHGYSLILKTIDKMLLVFAHLCWPFIYFMLSSTKGSSTISYHKLFSCLFKFSPGEPCCKFFQALLRPLFSLLLTL